MTFEDAGSDRKRRCGACRYFDIGDVPPDPSEAQHEAEQDSWGPWIGIRGACRHPKTVFRLGGTTAVGCELFKPRRD